MKFDNMAELKGLTMSFDNAIYQDVNREGDKLAEGWKAIFNTTQSKLVTIRKVKDRPLITHKDLVDGFIGTADEMDLKFKGVISGAGNKFRLATYFDNKDCNDTVKLGIVIDNNYARGGSNVGLYGFRTVCSNGMILTSVAKQQIKIANLEELRGALKTCINTLANEQQNVNVLIKTAMDDLIDFDYAKTVTKFLIRSKKHNEKICNNLIENKEKKISRWDIYNAITNYASNATDVTDGTQNNLQYQAQRILVLASFIRVKDKVRS